MGEVLQFRRKEPPKISASQVKAENKAPADADLGERIERIKTSILRINELMAELRGTPK
jgi:hypothetical protein